MIRSQKAKAPEGGLPGAAALPWAVKVGRDLNGRERGAGWPHSQQEGGGKGLPVPLRSFESQGQLCLRPSPPGHLLASSLSPLGAQLEVAPHKHGGATPATPLNKMATAGSPTPSALVANEGGARVPAHAWC